MTDEEFEELIAEIKKASDKHWWPSADATFHSIREALFQDFDMNCTAFYVSSTKNGESLTLEIFAYNKTSVYIVTVKSHLREDGLQQMLEISNDFPKFFTDHADKQLYGILAAVDISDDLRVKVLNAGIYLANIHDEHFRLQVPEDFKARNFQTIH